MAMAWALFLSGWRPVHTVANGQLLSSPLTIDQWWQGGAEKSEWMGHWSLVMVLPEKCSSECRQRLDVLTRMHMALGKDASRVRRVWLGQVSWQADPYLSIYPEYQLGVNGEPTCFVVDPLGNLILVYQKEQPAKDILKDLKKLLAASNIG
ncbi:hypothetical protein [Pokkaliibacter plantistimulans]|nr:hypothetical protein [Pokkaliibacter plantistimulans]